MTKKTGLFSSALSFKYGFGKSFILSLIQKNTKHFKIFAIFFEQYDKTIKLKEHNNSQEKKRPDALLLVTRPTMSQIRINQLRSNSKDARASTAQNSSLPTLNIYL